MKTMKNLKRIDLIAMEVLEIMELQTWLFYKIQQITLNLKIMTQQKTLGNVTQMSYIKLIIFKKVFKFYFLEILLRYYTI